MGKATLGPLMALFIILVLTISSYGAPPSTLPNQESANTQSLNIEYPFIDAVKSGESIKFHLHVYNSTGSLINNNTALYCSLHIYDNQGGHLVEQAPLSWDSNGVELSYTFTNTARVGAYPWVASCNTTQEAGFLSSVYYVTSSGFPTSEFYGVTVFLIYFFMVIGLLLIIHTFKKDSSTIFVYGTIGATISFIFLSIMLAGFNVFDGVTFIIDVNYYIMALITAIGLYMGIISFTFYADQKNEKN